MICFESKSLGDSLAWIPYVEEFRIKNKCHVICSTFKNDLFKGQYPEIEFVEPGVGVNNIYGLYRLGLFYDDNRTIRYDNHPTNPKVEPLGKGIYKVELSKGKYNIFHYKNGRCVKIEAVSPLFDVTLIPVLS